MLNQPHSTVTWPALLIVVTHDVLIIGIRVLRQESLDQVARILFIKLEDNVDFVDIPHVEPDWMAHFGFCVLETHEFVWLLHLTSQLECPLLAKHAQIEHQSIVLEDKAGKLEATDEAI